MNFTLSKFMNRYLISISSATLLNSTAFINILES
jgi:hypothetical protein